eukprot:5825976-Alexandrium_andersonii.AAC.1
MEMPQETMGNQLRAQRAGNRQETEEITVAVQDAGQVWPPAGAPLGTAESASSAVYAPTEPQVPEYSL